LQPQIDAKQVNQQQPISDLLGSNVAVEDNQTAAPLPPVQQAFRQQSEQNQQQTNQNLQQNFAQDLNSEMQVQQQNSGGESNFVQNFAPVSNNITTTQPVTQVENPEAAAQAARENESIPAQIVQQARMIRSAENTEMVINLKPEHLGQLTLRVSVSQNGAVNASFYSDNAQVRAAIENSLVQLRQELNDQGLKVENVQVYAGLTDGGLMNGQGGQAWQQNQQQSANRRIDFDALQEEVDAVTPDNENISEDGVDYKV
jgi:flagellar hook-length control protein FliK